MVRLKGITMGVVEQVKDIAKLAQDVHAMPLYEKLVAMQADLVQMVDEISTLKRENRELHEALSLTANMRFERNLYWRLDEGQLVGPYCPKCFHINSKAVPMLSFPEWMGKPRACPACAFMIEEDGGSVRSDVAARIAFSLNGAKKGR
jgi:hypothetical protein